MAKMLFCDGKKCKQKKNCLRYLEVMPPKELLTNFTQICNKKNDYRWIYLEDSYNGRLRKFYNKRKKCLK